MFFIRIIQNISQNLYNYKSQLQLFLVIKQIIIKIYNNFHFFNKMNDQI
jgi:hypothetical protein